MLCEKFKLALIEAALTGADVPPALRAHAGACPSCAAELTHQRALIAAIDSNLHRQMNAPVPAAMFHRFEARLAQEPQPLPSRSLRFTWLYAAAAFAITAALIVFALPKLHTHKSNPQTVALTPFVPLQSAQPVANDHPQARTVSLKPAVQPATRSIKLHAQTVAASQPEILVPPDEQIALDHFVAQRNPRREFVVALAVSAHQGVAPSFNDLEIPDINTAEIFIQPIATESRR